MLQTFMTLFAKSSVVFLFREKYNTDIIMSVPISFVSEFGNFYGHIPL